jgi:hypothetical protein
MTRFKDFGAGGEVVHEPLSFTLYGEKFECYPAIQGKTLLLMVADADSDDTAKVANIVTTFFEKTLLPESYERFQDLLDDPERIVTVEALGEITSWMVEQYTERPTKEPERS